MFNEMPSSSTPRAHGALEITLHARAAEKAQALALGRLAAKKQHGKAGRGSKGLLSSLLAVLGIG